MTRGELEELFWGKILRDEGCSNKEGRRDILKALYSGQALRIVELPRICGLSEMAIYNFLVAMKNKGWVRKAEGSPARYEMIPGKREQLTTLLRQPFRPPAKKKIEIYPEITLSAGGKKVTLLVKSKADVTVSVIPAKKTKSKQK